MNPRWMLLFVALAIPLGSLLGGGAAEPPLRIGFGTADISPDLSKPVYLAGFGKNRKATKCHDPLMARTIVMAHKGQKIAIASIDVIGLFYDSVERIRARLNGCDYVLVSSTHNHEGPDTIGMWGPNLFTTGVDADYIRKIEDSVVAAIEQADRRLVEVGATRIGMARDADLLHDSRKPIVKHDELTAIQFLSPAGKTIGVTATWNCHPEVLDRHNTEVSADFVYATVKHLEDKFQAPAIYITGTVGGLMSAGMSKIQGADGQPLATGNFESTERYGQAVGRLAEKALADGRIAAITPFTIQRKEIYLPIDNMGYILGYRLGVLKRNAFGWSGDVSRAIEIDVNDPKQRLAAKTEIARLRLGELDIAAIPGEIYPELVLGKYQEPADPAADFPDASLEPSIYSRLDAPFRMIIGLANDELGYIIPKRQWDDRPPYCYGRKTNQYGEINSLGAETAPLICEAFDQMVRRK